VLKNRFTRFIWMLPIILSLAGPVVCLRAQESPAAGASEGEKLERQMATDIRAKNWKAVESRIAEGFQSVHPDGVRDRTEEIALLKKMNMGEFTLSNFKSTSIGDNIVVTFTMTVTETIDGKRLPAKPEYRLSVWKKGVSGWQWICHANLTPIP
jgi:hypothetical protein